MDTEKCTVGVLTPSTWQCKHVSNVMTLVSESLLFFVLAGNTPTDRRRR